MDTPLKPLAISCLSTDCDHDLHCYRKARRKAPGVQAGACRDCGKALVDWSRLHRRDPADVGHTFEAMRTELIRHHYWHKEFDGRALERAHRRGRAGLRAAAEKRVQKALAPAVPAWDGRQTPLDGDVIYYAQHATATCCRKCVEEWHGIPRGVALTDDQVAYFLALILRFLDERLHDLPDEPSPTPGRG